MVLRGLGGTPPARPLTPTPGTPVAELGWKPEGRERKKVSWGGRPTAWRVGPGPAMPAALAWLASQPASGAGACWERGLTCAIAKSVSFHQVSSCKSPPVPRQRPGAHSGLLFSLPQANLWVWSPLEMGVSCTCVGQVYTHIHACTHIHWLPSWKSLPSGQTGGPWPPNPPFPQRPLLERLFSG